MLEAKVVYVDPADPLNGTNFVTRTAPVELDLIELKKLPVEGVLFIVMSTEWGNRQAMVERMWSNYNQKATADEWWGEDNYVIGVLGQKMLKFYPDPVDVFFTEQYPDSDDRLRVRAFGDEHQLARLAIPKLDRYEAGTNFMRFRGAWIDVTNWHTIALPLLETVF